MNLEPTADQLALRDSVRRFLSDQTPPNYHARARPDNPTDTMGTMGTMGTTETVWRGLADLGATGLFVPAEHGGAGLTFADAALVFEEFGRALYPGPWLVSAVAAPRALTRLSATDGTTDDAAKLLTTIANGSTIATISLPNATTPPTAAKERGDVQLSGLAVAEERGDDVTLSGPAIEVPDITAADVLLILAAEQNHRVALFAVDTASPGLAVTPQRGIDPTRKRFQVTLIHAPARRLCTAPEEAVHALVDDVLVATSADALGAAQALLDNTVQYAKTRQQFGRPIGSFQAVQHLCVDMYETVELARAGVSHALWAADNAPAERHLAAVRTKAFAGQLATVGDTAIQVFGGIGYTWEHDAHRYLKRLLDWSAFLGSPDRYLQEIGAQLVKPRQSGE